MKRLTKHSVIYTLAEFLNRGLAFLLIPVFTAFLSPAQYGLLSVALAVGGVWSILCVSSMEGVFTRYYFDFQDEESRRTQRSSVWIILLALNLTLSLMLEFVVALSDFRGWNGLTWDSHLRYVIWTSFLANCFVLLPKTLFLVRRQPWRYALFMISLFIFSTGAALIFVVAMRQGVAGYLKGAFLGTLAISLPGAILILKNIRWTVDLRHVRHALGYSLPLLPHMLSLWALALSDRFILQRYTSLTDVGVYSLAYQIGSVIQILAISANSAIAPHYYDRAGKGASARLALSRIATGYLLVLAWAGTAIVILDEPVIHWVIADPAYWRATSVVPWFVAAFLARGFYFVFLNAVYFSKRLRALPIITVCVAVLEVSLNLILIPRYGMTVAAMVAFFAYTLQSFMLYYYAQKNYRLEYEFRKIIAILVAATTLSIIGDSISLAPAWLDIGVRFFLIVSFPVALTALGVIRISGLRTALVGPK